MLSGMNAKAPAPGPRTRTVAAFDVATPNPADAGRRRIAVPRVGWVRLVPILLLLPTVAGRNAYADSWLPFSDLAEASPSGRRYVIVRTDGTFEIHARRDGAAPYVPPVRAKDRSRPAPPVSPEAGDRRVARGELPHLPLEVHVANDGGFVAFEKYAHLGYGYSVVVVAPDGAIRAKLRLSDLFDRSIRKRFVHSVSSIWWKRACWLDERRGAVFVLTRGNQVRAVALADGGVCDPGVEPVLERIVEGEGSSRRVALEAALEASWPEAVPVLRRMAHSAAFPIELRLRAALGLPDLRRDSALQALFRRCASATAEASVRAAALSGLPEALGEEAAVPILQEAMKGEGTVWEAAQGTLTRIGRPAVSLLCERVRDCSRSDVARQQAAHALEIVRAPEAVPSLLEAARTMSYWAGWSALRAAIVSGGPELRPGLLRRLEQGSAYDGSLAAEYFRHHPGPDAIPPLEAACERWQGPIDGSRDFGGMGVDWMRRDSLVSIRAALAACRGESFDEKAERERAWRGEDPPRSPRPTRSQAPNRGRR